MEKIKLEPIIVNGFTNQYRVFFCANGDVIDESNGVDLGDFIRDVDGFFYFDPIRKDGWWSSYSMRLVSKALDKINKPYEDELKVYFEYEQLRNNTTLSQD